MEYINLIIGNDHAGFDLKIAIIDYCKNNYQQLKIIDVGSYSSEQSCDYPDYAHKVAAKIIHHKNSCAILICSTGIGMSIAANRHDIARAALCMNEDMAIKAREHNDANMLVLGAKLVDINSAYQILDKFLNTPFTGGRHTKRIKKINLFN